MLIDNSVVSVCRSKGWASGVFQTLTALWHGAVLVYQRAVKEALDDAPGPGEGESEDLYILDVLFPVGLQHQPAIVEAIEGMDRELVARMVEAGCIDEDILSMSLTEEELKELGVGDGGTAGGRVITEFASISAGSDHTCGVGADGYVGCWGSDFFGKASPLRKHGYEAFHQDSFPKV